MMVGQKNIKIRIISLTLGILFVIGHAVGVTSQANAANASLFNPGKIIDDSIFTNNTSMTAAQIQSFLDSKNSTCLKNFTTLSLTDDNGDGQVNETGSEPYGLHGNMTAAQVIKAAADIYKINPEVILATLEKEQGLISRTDCPDWRYNTALGYACPDTAPCNVAAYGFTRQIDYGVFHLRGFFDDSLNFVPYGVGSYNIAYSPDASCGSSVVNIQNRATAALYSYTPYQPNAAALAAGYGTANCGAYGNRNFYLYFTDWFGTTTGTILLQSPASPAVYLMSGNNRYGVPSYDVLKAYGLANLAVTPVSDAYMNSLVDGGTLGTLFKQDGSGAVYVADNGYRFGIKSYAQCVNWGYTSCLTSSTKSLASSVFNTILNGGDLQDLMLNGSSVSLMSNGSKLPFVTYQALVDKGYSSSNITPITNSFNSSQPIGNAIPENNSFIKFGNDPRIFIYNNGLFYSIDSYDTFQSILPKNTPVYTDQSSLYATNPPQSTRSVPKYINIRNGSEVYMFGGGQKINITAVKTDWPASQAFDEISTIIDKHQTNATLDVNSTLQTPDGMLFQVKSQNIQQFYSLYDFFSNASTSKQPIKISNDLVNGLTQSNRIIANGAGSLLQTTDPSNYNMIYLTNTDGTTCALSNIDQLGGFKLEAGNVQRLATLPGSYKGTLKSLVSTQNGLLYIISSGQKTTLSPATAANWGISGTNSCSFTDQFLTRFSSPSQSAFTFARLPDGTIYTTGNGATHQITTYAKFLSLGGNVSNTVNVPYDFLTYVTLGSQIN